MSVPFQIGDMLVVTGSTCTGIVGTYDGISADGIWCRVKLCETCETWGTVMFRPQDLAPYPGAKVAEE